MGHDSSMMICDDVRGMTIGEVAELARSAGVRVSVLVDGILGAIDDDCHRDVEGAAEIA